MTGKETDAGSGAKPELRLVSSTGPEPLPTADDLAPDEFGAGQELELVGADQLIDLGLAPGPDQEPDLDFLLVPLLTEAELQMRSIRRALDAEMWASELLGMLELGAPDDSTAEERDAVTLNLATRLAEYAEDQESASGLAILRTLSVIGPLPSRELAREAASEMAENFKDRAWTAELGRPEIGRCWRFRDAEGSQESLTVVFRYGKREHTLTVLIDHVLGGGVKDCWIGENPEAVLTEARSTLEPEGIEIEFIGIDQAALTLSTALTRPECPETAEELEDVAMSRALLRSRVEHLVGEGLPDGLQPGSA